MPQMTRRSGRDIKDRPILYNHSLADSQRGRIDAGESLDWPGHLSCMKMMQACPATGALSS